MTKFAALCSATLIALSLSGVAGAQEQAAPSATAGREVAQARRQQPAPQQQQAQQQAQPTPSPEQIKEGARKLAKEIGWEKIPGDLFRRYQGTWVGNYWAYSLDGKLQQTSKTKVEFKIQKDGSMKMESYYFDLLSKSYFTAEVATYRINGDEVVVTIERGQGKTDRQVGHWNDGQLFLVSNIKDGVEHFRERIDGKRLLIDGFGVYGSLKGKDQHVFIGRYLREN